MKVTKLSSQKKDPSRVNLYIDGEFVVGISLNSVAKYNLYVTKEVSESELEEILFCVLKDRFQERAMGYISRALHTQYQLRKYLRDLAFKKKGTWYSDISKEELENIFNEIIEKIQEYGYLDDSVYAEQFILSRIKNKPRGKNILISELISKGVHRDIARKKVEELVEDEYDILVKTYNKKYKEKPITINDRKKIDFLRRKGFSWDLIQKYIDNESAE